MKGTLRFLTAMFIMLLLAGPVTAAESPWAKKLPFKQAVITYQLIGMEQGQEILYIRDYGRQMARHRAASTTVLGMTKNSRSVEIITPDWIYLFDLQEESGTKSVNPQKLMIEEYNKLSAADREKVNENAKKTATTFMGGMQGMIELDAREILGYSCDKTSAMGTVVYSIHGTPISLLTESNIMGVSLKSAATSIEDRDGGDSYFQFPAGIVPQANPEADRMAAIMAEQTIAALKDPEAFKQSSQGFIGLPPGGQPAIPEEDQMQMEEAMKTLKGLLGK